MSPPTFPQQMVFSQKDFECFEERHRRNREYNQFRLRVRRKLGQLGSSLLAGLTEKGLHLVAKTSLHHPYTYNAFSVDSQWVYFSPDRAGCRILKEKLGPVGEDLDLHYVHILLLVGIHLQGLFISLKIHPNAWWDGQNLKNKCREREKRTRFLALLHDLKDFFLRLDQWPNRHSCQELNHEEISRYFQYYTPGEHWFHLDCDVSREEPLATSGEFENFAGQKLASLIGIYNFIKWSPDNNYVFSA